VSQDPIRILRIFFTSVDCTFTAQRFTKNISFVEIILRETSSEFIQN